MTPFTDAQLAWLKQEFDRCLPYIEAALHKPHQPYTAEHVKAEIIAGHAQLWPASRAAIVTKIEDHPDGSRTVLGWIAGGDRAQIEGLIERATAWAKGQGCTKARTIQRMGFARKPLRGFRPTSIVMERDI